MNRGLNGISNESWDVSLGTRAASPPIETGNTLVGFQAGQNHAMGSFSTLIGYQAGQNATSSGMVGLVCVGYQSGLANTTGGSNTFVGYQSGLSNTTSGGITCVGANAGQNHTTGTENTFVGSSAGISVTSSGQQTAVGFNAGFSVTTNGANTFIGTRAGQSYTGGVGSVFLGTEAGYKPNNTTANASTTPTHQTVLGYQSGQNSTTQRNDVVTVGYKALVDGNNAIAIGSGVLAGAAGCVAIGMDSGGTSASTTTQDEIKLGTATHTATVLGKSKVTAHAKTSGALSTATLSSGTGAQIDSTSDRETVTPVTFNPGAATTATALVEISPDNVTYSALGTETEPVGVALDGTIHLLRFQVPAAWYLRITVTNAVLGTTTYY